MVVADPKLNHRLRAGATGTIGGIEYRTDASGFRIGAKALTYPAERVAFGDSVTMGWGVAGERAWPSLLDPPAVNAGVLGYGIVEVTAAVEAFAAISGPSDVQLIVGYYPNDPEPVAVNAGAASNDEAAAPSTSSWGLVRLWNRVAGPRESSAIDRYRALHALDSAGLQAVIQSLDRLAAVQTGRRRIVIVLLPALEGFDGLAYSLDGVHKSVARLATDRGLTVVDLQGVPTQQTGPPSAHWVSADDSHPNAVLHAAYAAAIEAALRKNADGKELR